MYKKIKTALVNFAVSHYIMCLFIAAGIFLGALPFLSGIDQDFSAKTWFRAEDSNIQTLELFEKTFGSDEVATLVIEADEDVFNPRTMKIIKDLTESLWQAPEVIRVQSITNFYWTRAIDDEILTEEFLLEDELDNQQYLDNKRTDALNHRVIPNYLVSKNTKSAVIYAYIAHNPDKQPDYANITRGMKEIAKKYQEEPGIKFHFMGQPPLSSRFQKVSFDDLFTMSPLLMLLVILYLIFCFRTFIGVAIPTLIIILSLVTTAALLGVFGLTINSLTFVLPSVLIAISIADSVHIMATFYDEFSKTGDKVHACRFALSKNLWPIALTTFSTMIGFFSLTTSEIKPVAELGLLAGIGTMLALVFSYLTVIPLLMIFNNEKSHKNLNSKMLPEISVRKYLSFIERNRIIIIVTSFFTTALFVYLAILCEIDSNPYKYFDAKDPITKGNTYLIENYGGVFGPEVIIDSGEEGGIKSPDFLYKVEAFQKWLSDQSYVNNSVSIINILKEMNQSLNQGKKEFYSIPKNKELVAQELFLYTMSLPAGMDLNNRMDLAQSKLRLSILWSLQSSKDSLLAVKSYEEKAKELGLNITTTGKPILFHRMNSYVVFTFFTSIALALFIITIIMILIFKNVKLGLLSIIPNFVPIIFGAGLLKILDKPIDIGCAIVASVTLGIAVDDTIHFLTHYNTLKKLGVSRFEAMVKVFTTTGLALIVTTVILVSCFGLFMFASLMPNINFGILCALVLSIALICDLVLLPAIIFCYKD
ncbi:hypothetical protein A9Q84_12205 [Halobacteriovorax marinus]|uniref:SSD domain-containing protein n=1 Tax=Halobacteriovorax marinus TaxID=97084 RepID=A0A1Y5F819_9BACT|nr:hypothetical protein A9Q84_12205 [Halobacteriovorax marinus]